MTTKRRLLGLILLLAIAAFGYAGTGSADQEEIRSAVQSYDQANSATLYLRVLGSDGKLQAAGSGAIISAGGSALTAYHVVKGGSRVEAVMNDGRSVGPVKVASYDETEDIAVLELPDPQSAKLPSGAYPYLTVRTEALKFGETVYALGYPLKSTPIITQGIINNPRAKINGRDRILTSAQIVSGMSGGPLIDGSGKLAGTISGSLRTMDNIHLVVDTEAIRRLLPAKLK
ncbi:trypsin-like peptidase domain-containing protein [Paenibacillus spiritus]|uniref:Trypsin-like peptidase domain-containing protein n=1 Tax=Paenibacillus spiritus TaxID=2496557 RepID=A0A5J5FUN3_9BACL|nr:serine protease [Paenibacillus spiritus]KAA8997245.1 trypsin-like peptidase domain-containing protein [Paenibacillus spiritus]